MVLRARYALWPKDADPAHAVWPVRFSREIEYLLYFLSGAAYIAYPSPTITENIGATYSLVWSVFLCLGGFIGLLALTRVVVFEYVCLPLLITAMALFGLSAINRAIEQWGDGETVIWIIGMIFLSVAFGLVARMRDVRQQMEVQRTVRLMLEEEQQRSGEPR